MKIIPGLLAGLWLSATSSCLAAEWKDLFDGTTLDGWKAQTTANWRVDHGLIVADKGREGLLTTTGTYTDYEIEVVFRAKEDTRSGICLSSPVTVTDPGSECYKLAIGPTAAAFPTGSLEGRTRVASDRFEGWRTYRAKVDGAKVTVWLDGRQVVEYEDRQPIKSGHIGLQFNQGTIEFSKVRIKNNGMP